MAKEITIGLRMTVDKSPLSVTVPQQTFNADMAGANYSEGTLSLTTAWLAIPLGAVVTAGWLLTQNHDDVNNVEVGFGPGGSEQAAAIVEAINSAASGDIKWSAPIKCAQAPKMRAVAGTPTVKFLVIEA